MRRFEYDITKHPADEFAHVVYFCTDKGECSLSQVPSDQMKALYEILNRKGNQGWELVQMIFGDDGMVAVWKREAQSEVLGPEGGG